MVNTIMANTLSETLKFTLQSLPKNVSILKGTAC